jgi:predicted ATPase
MAKAASDADRQFWQAKLKEYTEKTVEEHYRASRRCLAHGVNGRTFRLCPTTIVTPS